MRGQKKLVKIAKDLFRESLSAGFVDPQKVRSLSQVLVSQKPAGLLTILKNYKRLLEQKLAWEEIIIETAAEAEGQKQLEAYLIKKSGARKIRYRINPKIVFGAKISHGDWVYDATLQGKLKQLTNAQ